MDESSLSSLITLVLLVVAHSVIAMAYAALISPRTDSPLENPLMGNAGTLLVYQLSGLVLRFSMAAVALTSLVPAIAPQFGDGRGWIAVLAVLVPVALVDLIFGELLPLAVGSAYAEMLAPALRPVMNAVLLVLRPFIWVFYRLNRVSLQAMGGPDNDETITEEELLNLIDAGHSFEDDERKMIHSVLQLDETTVTEMMIPRIDIVAVERKTPIADARRVFLESGHSRLPVYEDNIDNIIGLAYVKDLLEVWHNGDTVVQTVDEIIRPAHFVPETMTADQLLREFRKSKVHMFIVMEEYGGTGGLVTLENLLEEIVGDIQDEYDEGESEEIVKISDDEYRVDAGMTLSDLSDMLDVDLDDTDVDTLGGFIFWELERVPEEGEIVETDGITLKVLTVEGRRIREVLVTRRESQSKDERSDETDNDEDLVKRQAESSPQAAD